MCFCVYIAKNQHCGKNFQEKGISMLAFALTLGGHSRIIKGHFRNCKIFYNYVWFICFTFRKQNVIKYTIMILAETPFLGISLLNTNKTHNWTGNNVSVELVEVIPWHIHQVLHIWHLQTFFVRIFDQCGVVNNC